MNQDQCDRTFHFNETAQELYIVFQDLREKRETVFFRDGQRKIDYVLAYRDKDGEDGIKAAAKRAHFEQSLLQEGLELENEKKEVCM